MIPMVLNMLTSRLKMMLQRQILVDNNLCHLENNSSHIDKNRELKAHASGRNIVGQQHATLLRQNMLRPFACNHNSVGTCWHLLSIV